MTDEAVGQEIWNSYQSHSGIPCHGMKWEEICPHEVRRIYKYMCSVEIS
jgi:hypothetical protein